MTLPARIPTGTGPARHAWRGLHLDSARTFWQPAVIVELLHVMARYRLNRLHWHLTDDAGWRFAVPGYPELVRAGANLTREPFEWYDNVNREKRQEALKSAPANSTHGCYTDEDIAGIVDTARQLDIEIMPEVDLPGHMAAAIRAYPELGDPHLARLPVDAWTHRNDLLWPGRATEALLRAVLDRVCDLFCFEYVHVGGDECNFAAWNRDPELMQSFGDDPKAIQRHFTDLARECLRTRGRKAAVWDEAADSGLQGDDLVFAWRYRTGVAAAQRSGNPWVYVDANYLYLNHLAGPEEHEPAGMREIVRPRDVLAAPVPADALGVQAACWVEFITDRAGLHYHLFPRLLAAAELAWNGPREDWSAFEPMLKEEVESLELLGIVGRPLDA